MKRICLVLLLLTTTVAGTHAQKVGHLNFGNLLSDMPATDAADKEMEKYQGQLIADGEVLVQQLKRDITAARERESTTAPVKMQEIRAQLQKDQRAIQVAEQQLPVKLEQRRRELLAPIVKRAKAAIRAVAEEQGYDMIFDSSLFNSVLFAEDSTDLMAAVKAKLGIE